MRRRVTTVLRHITVEPVVFLYMFATFGEFSCYQDLVWEKVCRDYFNSSTCTISKTSPESEALTNIQTRTANQLLYNNIALTCASIIGSFIAGSYGDINGRILPLIIPPLLSIAAQILYLCSALYLQDSSVYVLAIITVAILLGGISGGCISLMANSFGFVSDITDSKTRTLRMIALEVCICVGEFLGSISAGFILKQFSSHGYHKYYVAFGLLLGIHALLVLYIWARIRGYPVPDRPVPNRKSRFTMLTVYNMFADVIKTIAKPREANNRRLIALIFAAFILITYASEVMTSLLFLYVRNRPLLWQTSDYSFYTGLKFGVTGAALLALPVIKVYLWPTLGDIIVAIVGVLSRTAGLVLIGFATNSALMYSTIVPLMFIEYPLPIIRSLLSKLVDTDERGKVFAFMTLWYNLCSLSGGIVFPILYKHSLTTGGYTGTCFQLAASFQLVAIALFM